MKKLLLLAVLCPMVARADTLPLDDALRATYNACVGIDEELADLKKMAGINTAVTAVGTGLGAGATVVGIVKASKDAKAKAKYDDYVKKPPREVLSQSSMDAFFYKWKTEFSNDAMEYDKLRQQSKKLGDWRTGLMAGSAATSITSAVLAGRNKVSDDLQGQIDNCRASVKELKNSIAMARTQGVDVTEAVAIANTCGEFEYVDISKINKRARGAMISSVVGAATGVAGTVTSGVANSESVRKDNSAKSGEKSKSDLNKEKNINTAANVLAGASTAASATATIFNATQISAIKKVAVVAEKCTGVLK